MAEFRAWAQHFAPNRVAFSWGYASDAAWTRPMCSSAEALKQTQDAYLAITPNATLLMASESLFFEIEGILPAAPMR